MTIAAGVDSDHLVIAPADSTGRMPSSKQVKKEQQSPATAVADVLRTLVEMKVV